MKFNLDFIYPIGSIYINTNEINPSMIFGGTWERIQGRYLMGAGTPSQNTYDGFGMLTANDLKLNFQPATLGEYAHTLTINEIPPHSHTIGIAANDGWNNSIKCAGTPDTTNRQTWSAGGGNAHNNLPPTIVVYMWKRIA